MLTGERRMFEDDKDWRGIGELMAMCVTFREVARCCQRGRRAEDWKG